MDDYSSDSSLTNHQLRLMKNFDPLRFKAQQQQVTRGIILKEADTFTTDDTQIGDVNTHKLKIQLKDQVPIQKNYGRIL